jgi:hypothetical protein
MTQRGQIYRIYTEVDDSCYIGSTTKSISFRLSNHFSTYKSWLNGKREYRCSVYDIFDKGLDKVKIELLEDVAFTSVNELHRIEGYFIRTSTNCVNLYVAGRTETEHKKERINCEHCGQNLARASLLYHNRRYH